jgi:hypothetical protein
MLKPWVGVTTSENPAAVGHPTPIRQYYDTVSWGAAMAGQDGVDRVATPLQTITQADTTDRYITFDSAAVIAAIQDWINNPTNNNGVLLSGEEVSQPSLQYLAGINYESIYQRPQLNVTYGPAVNIPAAMHQIRTTTCI